MVVCKELNLLTFEKQNIKVMKLTYEFLLKFALLIAFMAFFLYFIPGCKNDCVCTNIYAPVCGDNGVQYGNACSAKCDGVTYTDGACPREVVAQVIIDNETNAECHVQILIDYVTYIPDTLDANYAINGKMIRLNYRPLNELIQCGTYYQSYEKIEVFSVTEY